MNREISIFFNKEGKVFRIYKLFKYFYLFYDIKDVFIGECIGF